MRFLSSLCLVSVLGLSLSAQGASPIYVDPVAGSDSNNGLSAGSAFATITAGVNAVDANGEVIVAAGKATENVALNKPVTLTSSAPSGDTIITAAPSATNSAVITVAADDVVIDGFTIEVNQPQAAVGIHYQSGTNLTVSNNTIYTTGTGAVGSTYAAGIPTGSLGVAANNLGSSITLTNNTIGFSAENSPPSIAPFDRAVFLRSVNGTIQGNDIAGVNHDLVLQFVHGAPMLVQNNNFLGWGNDNYKGAQLDITEPENSVTVSNNTFSPQADESGKTHIRSLMIKNNGGISAANLQISNNTFNIRKVGILAANSIGETISGNAFLPVAGAASFQAVQISNKVPTGGTVAPRTNNAVITGNTFGAGDGTGIAFLNHNSAPEPSGGLFGSIVVGGADAAANSFASGLTTYMDLDGASGSSTASSYPGYSVLANTTIAPFPADVNVADNTFAGVSGSAASVTQSFSIEDHIKHGIDTDRPIATGVATWKSGEYFITDPAVAGSSDSSIQRGIDVAETSNTVHVQSGDYTELVTASKANLVLLGDGLPSITAPAAGSNKAVVNVTATGVTVQGFEVAVNQPYAAVGIAAKGTAAAVSGLNILNNTISTTGNGGVAASGNWTPFGSATGEAATGIAIYNTGAAANGFFANIKGNTIGTAAAPFSQAGIFLEKVLGSVGGANPGEGNTTYGEDFDLIARFVSAGTLNVQGNNFNGWGYEGNRGAQMEIGEPGAAGVVLVQNNTFTPQSGTSPHGRTSRRSLQVKNYSSPTGNIAIVGNQFNVQNTGVALTNAVRADVTSNTFEAAADGALLLEVNNKIYSSSDSYQSVINGSVHNSANVLNNTFANTASHANVTGIEFRDHTQTNAAGAGPILFKDLVVGNPSAPNTFKNELSSYIKLSNLDGPTNGAGAAIYGSIASVTEMDPFSDDIIAAYNFFGTGSELKLPVNSTSSDLQAMEAKIQDKDDIAELGQVLLFAPVINLDTNNYYATIQAAIDDPATVNGNTIAVYPTSFTELVNINKSITLESQDASAQTNGAPTVKAPATGSSAAVISINAPNVTVKDLDVIVEHPYAWSGIRGVASNFDGVTITNNTISAAGSYTYTSGQYHYGIELPNTAGTGRNVTLSKNIIEAQTSATAFQRGIYLRSCHGVVGGASPADGNAIKAGIQDLLAQFVGFGALDVQNNTFRGAGVDITEPDSHGSVNIASNKFTPEQPAEQSLLIKHSYSGAPVVVDRNQFKDHQYRAIVAAGSNNVTIKNNDFDVAVTSPYPVAHIELNTKWPGTVTAPYSPNGYTVIDNIFTNTGSSAVDGVRIANGLPGSQTPDFAKLEIGTEGHENTFAASLNQFVVLSSGAGDAANVNISIANNKFDVGSGAITPAAFAFDQNFRLEDKVSHKVDHPTAGLASWIPNVIFVTTPEPGSPDSDVGLGVAAAGADYTVYVESGTYTAPTPVVDSKTSVTIMGPDSVSRPVLVNGVNFANTNADITLANLVLQGKADGGSNTVVGNSGAVNNITFNNVAVNGQNVPDRFGIIGGSYNGAITFDSCQFEGILGWAAFDSKSGGSGSSITTGTFVNNTVTSVAGHINFRHNPAVVPFPDVLIADNTITGGDTLTTGASSAIKVFNGNNVSVVDNVFQGIPAEATHIAGEEADGSAFMPRNVSKLYVSNNVFSSNNIGIAVERNQPVSSGVVADNVFTGNGVGIYVPNNATAAGNLQIADNHFDGQTTFSIRNGSSFTISAPHNWFGAPTGPAAASNGGSANVVITPWIGAPGMPEDDYVITSSGQTSATLAASVTTPNVSAVVDIAPATGTFSGGELFTIYEDNTAPFQGTVGFEAPGALPRSLFVNTQVPDGSFVSTIRLGYDASDLPGFTENKLFLATWDAKVLSWVPAVSLNTAGTTQTMGNSAPPAPTVANLGKYGIDIANKVVWAVVDHASEYAVGAGTENITAYVNDWTMY